MSCTFFNTLLSGHMINLVSVYVHVSVLYFASCILSQSAFVQHILPLYSKPMLLVVFKLSKLAVYIGLEVVFL